jgi:hypothetical protein
MLMRTVKSARLVLCKAIPSTGRPRPRRRKRKGMRRK